MRKLQDLQQSIQYDYAHNPYNPFRTGAEIVIISSFCWYNGKNNTIVKFTSNSSTRVIEFTPNFYEILYTIFPIYVATTLTISRSFDKLDCSTCKENL